MIDLSLTEKDRFLLKIFYFFIVMIFFGAVVFFISNSELDVIQVREMVAVQSTTLLNIAGYNAVVENKNFIVYFGKDDFSNGVLEEILSLSSSERPSIKKEKNVFISVLKYTDETKTAFVNALKRNNLKWLEEGPTIIMQFTDSDKTEKTFRSSIVRECVGYISILAMIGLMLGYPFASFRKKIIGVFVGVSLIYIVNIIRIITIMISVYDFGYWVFDLFHLFLWQEGMMTASLLIWFCWTRIPEDKFDFWPSKEKKNNDSSKGFIHNKWDLIKKKDIKILKKKSKTVSKKSNVKK